EAGASYFLDALTAPNSSGNTASWYLLDPVGRTIFSQRLADTGVDLSSLAVGGDYTLVVSGPGNYYASPVRPFTFNLTTLPGSPTQDVGTLTTTFAPDL